jgi:hypothetical protein
MFSRAAYGVSVFALIASAQSGAALAQERGLIWSPVKNSDQSYTTRIGAKLPVDTPIRAGLEMGLSSSKTGAITDTPVRFWGNMTILAQTLPGASIARDIGVLMNALTGSSTVSMTSTQKRIVTPTLDLEANRNVTMRYDGTAQQWSGLDVSQSLRLTKSETGTAFVLTGASRDTFDEFSSRVSLEQKLSENLTVSGTLNQGYEDRFRPSVSARYSIKW